MPGLHRGPHPERAQAVALTSQDLNDSNTMRVLLWEAMSERGMSKEQFNTVFWPRYLRGQQLESETAGVSLRSARS